MRSRLRAAAPPFAANATVQGLQMELERRVQDNAAARLRSAESSAEDQSAVILGLRIELESKSEENKRLNELLIAVSHFLTM